MRPLRPSGPIQTGGGSGSHKSQIKAFVHRVYILFRGIGFEGTRRIGGLDGGRLPVFPPSVPREPSRRQGEGRGPEGPGRYSEPDRMSWAYLVYVNINF